MARAEAYLHAKFRVDPSNRLATVHERHRQDRQRTDSIGRTIMLSDRCPVCLSRLQRWCTNGWMDQDETRHAGRPRPWPHCVNVLDRDPAAPPPQRPHPQFSARICCGQMAGWIKMPLGTEVNLSPGDVCVKWDRSSRLKGAQPHHQFLFYVYCGQMAG